MPKIVLCLIKPEKYLQGLVSALSELKTPKVIYISANKSYNYLKSILDKEKINYQTSFFFIDCVSKKTGEAKGLENSNCVFLSGLQNLSEISIAAHEVIKSFHGEKILILDSMSTLLVYNNTPQVMEKFSNFFVNKIRSYGIDAIIFALESDSDKDVIKQLKSLVDEVKKI